MSAALEQVAELVRRETGISLGQAQLPSIEAALRRVDPALDAAAFLRVDLGRREGGMLLERLIDEVTVNETFFFRQRRELDDIDWPRLLRGAHAAGRDTVRVWVAACASGEEAYTLVMLASAAFGSAVPPVSVLATDISPAILDKARRARYGERAVRSLTPELRRHHFVDHADGIEAGRALRDMVEFRQHNLASDPPPAPGSFDLIACRNVLIYFDGETVERVIGVLERGLAPGGMLLLGAADRLCGSARRLAVADPIEQELSRMAGDAPERALRRPLGHEPAEASPAGLAAALQAANDGRLDTTLELTERLLKEDPLDANVYFVRGLAELGVGDPDSAAGSLRRALYVDPGFGLAAFQLGRAHEERGDDAAAARAYEQALGTLGAHDDRHDAILAQVDIGDVASACAIRLRALREAA